MDLYLLQSDSTNNATTIGEYSKKEILIYRFGWVEVK